MSNFRVIIAGSRSFNNYDYLKDVCDKLLVLRKHELDGTSGKGITVICGEAKGADSLGKRYAEENGFDIDSKPADWDKYGKSAGYRRNVEMAEHAHALILFWDGVSPGSKHMLNIATEKGLLIRVFKYELE